MKVKELIPNPKVDFVISSRDRSQWVWVTDTLDKSKRIRLLVHHDDFHINMDINPALYYCMTGKTVIVKEQVNKENFWQIGHEFPIVFIGE